MGIMGESLLAYAQPLIDQSDGSLVQLNRCMSIAQMCWNLAVTPEDEREESLLRYKASMGLDDDEFEQMKESVIIPMVNRHFEMFPLMHDRIASGHAAFSPDELLASHFASDEPMRAGRNDPCPCGSGKKFKKCCLS